VTRVKVCCIASVDEARMAIAAGAWAIGLVAEMPSGPGPIADGLIAEIAKSVHGEVETFLLTSRTDADAIIEHHASCGTTTLQLVDQVDADALRRVRAALPRVRLVQVIHVRGEECVGQSRAVAPLVDALLLDSGNPSLEVKELGGTGRTHDWNISKRIREAVDVPVFLAGGLHPGNVTAAIRQVRPFGVDLCSGIRERGVLDQRQLAGFFASVRTV
jgi:phosphoribosylanthranilate isomerase